MVDDLVIFASERLHFLRLAILTVSIWLGWRIWFFYIRPRLLRHEVDILPYTIPFFGHLFPMFRNIDKLYAQAHVYYGQTRKPYALHVLGQDIFVITNPLHMGQVYKDDKSYSFDAMMSIIYRVVGGISTQGDFLLWRKPSDGFTSLYPNPQNNVLAHVGQKLLHKQLLTAEPFQDMISKVGYQIEHALRWDQFRPTSLLCENGSVKLVSLNNWVRDIIVNSQTKTFFGPYIFEVEPDIAVIFNAFDWNSWMLTYQYPAFFCKAATKPREKLVKAFSAYIDAPRETRADSKVQFLDELVDEMRHAGLSTEDCARLLMILLWGVNANAQMTTFWIMTEILKRPSLVSAIRDEIAPAMETLANSSTQPTETEAMKILRSHVVESCPLLSSVYNETLRMYSTGASVRITKQETYIDGRRIPANVKLLLPQRQLLQERDVYGPNAHEFDAWRFLKCRNLDRHEFFKPYGGGVSYCRGKAAGRFEVMTFVAWVLWKYDCDVLKPGEKAFNGVEGKELPRLDVAKPSVGIGKPMSGDDMLVLLRRR